jgi:hypothetical protein
MEVAFCASGFDHIVHLAEQVHEQDWLVVKVLKPVELLLVEVVHFLRRYYLVVVEVNNAKPVVKRLHCAFVFLAEHKVYKVFVAHFTWLVGLELSRHLIKDAVDSFATQRVPLIPAEVFFVYYKVMVGVELPKSAVKYIKMLVTKELSNFIDVVLFCNCLQNTEQV